MANNDLSFTVDSSSVLTYNIDTTGIDMNINFVGDYATLPETTIFIDSSASPSYEVDSSFYTFNSADTYTVNDISVSYSDFTFTEK